MVKKFIGSGRAREGGLAAVHRQDFKAHTTGGSWRHKAKQIDMSPGISTFNNVFNSSTVQGTLEKMASVISTLGQGYITIGDGYDTGIYNAPPLDQAFADALTNPRLQSGGVILVKAGVYYLSETVNIPAGITVMGEPGGTYIFGQMNEKPMFHLRTGNDRFNLAGGSFGTIRNVEPIDQIKFYNLVLGDNTDGYFESSGVAIPTMTTTGFLECEVGSNVVVEDCTFLGRVNPTFPPLEITKRGIFYAGTNPGKPTALFVKDCYFDMLQSAVEFDGPTEGNTDSLRVESCRARLFGDTTSGNREDVCFVSFNLCNAHFESNLHTAASNNFQTTCFYLKNTVVSNPERVRVSMVNNTGGITNSTSTYSTNELLNFFYNDYTTTDFEAVKIGNSWGRDYNSSWFFTVGDGTSSVGDLNGSNALEIAFQRSDIGDITTGEGTQDVCIVNPGTYTLTTGGTSNMIKLVGNDRNGVKPVINLNSGSGTDANGNPTTSVGHLMKNIEFASNGASFNTITVIAGSTSSNRYVLVENCKFSNAGIDFDAMSGSIDNVVDIEVKDTQFDQDGTYNDNIGMYSSGNASSILLERCSFTNLGYALQISSGSSVRDSQITLRDCNLNQNPYSTPAEKIGNASPSGNDNYVYISDTNARVLLENTTILCNAPGFFSTSRINSSLAVLGNFDKYIYISARDIIIESSELTGPAQTFSDGGTPYALPTLSVTPGRFLTVSNSDLTGSLALQLTGSAFTNIGGTDTTGIKLHNSRFNGTGLGSVDGTCVDLDCPDYVVVSSDFRRPTISISNCFVDNKNGSNTGLGVRHTNQTTAKGYDAGGALQVYASGWQVFCDSTYCAAEFDGSSTATGIVQLGAAVFDVIGDASTANLNFASIELSNNEFLLDRFASTGLVESTNVVTRAPYININGNSFFRDPNASSATNPNNYLEIWNNPVSTGGSGCTVTGNIFSNRNATGGLGLQAIFVASGSGENGIITDNVFDSPYVNSTSVTTLITGDLTGWIVERNKNQTVTTEIRTGSVGTHAVHNPLNDPLFVGSGVVDLNFRGVDGDESVINPMTINFLSSGSILRAVWSVSLNDVLPDNTYVVSLDMNTRCTVNPTDGDATLSLANQGSSTLTDTVDFTSGAGYTPSTVENLTITPGTPTDYRISPSEQTTVTFVADGQDGSNFIIYGGNLSITYRW